MSKTYRNEPIRIEAEDIPKARKGWGNTRPFTRIEEDKKKSKKRRECRNFKHNRMEDHDE